ncbi:hypothetical protein [Amycolatopsis sp. NPDC051071]|uniref:hypothetical protein n=1 Tax=Amycolatopsis sp. NPDC051071 TaxID=3154637 RepID=UPI00343EC93A
MVRALSESALAANLAAAGFRRSPQFPDLLDVVGDVAHRVTQALANRLAIRAVPDAELRAITDAAVSTFLKVFGK